MIYLGLFLVAYLAVGTGTALLAKSSKKDDILFIALFWPFIVPIAFLAVLQTIIWKLHRELYK